MDAELNSVSPKNASFKEISAPLKKRIFELLKSVKVSSEPTEIAVDKTTGDTELVWIVDGVAEITMEIFPDEDRIKMTVWPDDEKATYDAFEFSFKIA